MSTETEHARSRRTPKTTVGRIRPNEEGGKRREDGGGR
jgi:hypothetical protein